MVVRKQRLEWADRHACGAMDGMGSWSSVELTGRGFGTPRVAATGGDYRDNAAGGDWPIESLFCFDRASRFRAARCRRLVLAIIWLDMGGPGCVVHVETLDLLPTL